MSNNPRERQIGFNRGVRSCIAWLHAHADTMNDPHARAILNSAAFSLGADKPDPDPTILSQLIERGKAEVHHG